MHRGGSRVWLFTFCAHEISHILTLQSPLPLLLAMLESLPSAQRASFRDRDRQSVQVCGGECMCLPSVNASRFRLMENIFCWTENIIYFTVTFLQDTLTVSSIALELLSSGTLK